MALRTDELGIGGFVLTQDTDAFCFGMDAVLLSAFAAVKPGERVCDLGCGNGILPILLCAKYSPEFVLGVEVQQEAAALAQHNVVKNRLEQVVSIVCGDLREQPPSKPEERFDLVLSNPPYQRANSGLQNESQAVRIARHEICCTLSDVVCAAARLLRPRGRLCLVHRPERLCDLFCLLRAHGLEPKRLRMVYPKQGREPSNILVEAKQGARSGLRVLPSLIVYEQNGTYTKEIRRIYGLEE